MPYETPDIPLYHEPEYIRIADELEGHLRAVNQLMKELAILKTGKPDLITGRPRYEWVIQGYRPYFVRVRDE